MCRLFGMRASHPTRIDCGLLAAQNALIRQSEKDERGLVNDDGWGIGYVRDGRLHCEREVGPASESEEYRRDASRVVATTAVAHVRRATVGGAARENTHPFRHGRSMLAHNGHIGAFDRVRDELLAGMTPEHRGAIAGTTDSEHFFHLLLSRRARCPGDPPVEVLRDAIRDVASMVRETDPDVEVALSVLWTVGEELVGSRFGRSLWYLERDTPHRCSRCGGLHPDPERVDPEDYRSALVASEPITDEAWEEVPEGAVFRLDGELRLRFEPVGIGEAG